MSDEMNGDIQVVPIGQLLPHPQNPRVGDIDAIRKSIRAHGFYGTLVAQAGTGRLLKGNHTWRALQEEGYETVRVQYIDVTDDQALAIMLADNRASDLGTYDQEILLMVVESVPEEVTLYDTKTILEGVAKDCQEDAGSGIESSGGEEQKPPATNPLTKWTIDLDSESLLRVQAACDEIIAQGNASTNAGAVLYALNEVTK